jgi:hypothetical protein
VNIAHLVVNVAIDTLDVEAVNLCESLWLFARLLNKSGYFRRITHPNNYIALRRKK